MYHEARMHKNKWGKNSLKNKPKIEHCDEEKSRTKINKSFVIFVFSIFP